MRALFISLLLLACPAPATAQAPTISNITTTPQLAAAAQIRWITSAAATGQVFYDTVSRPSDTDGSQYAFTSGVDTSADITHQYRYLSYLTPNTTYFFKLRSSNGGGATFSAESSFTTAANGVRTSNLLIIRLNFPNDLASLPSDAVINSTMTGINAHMVDYSLGQSDITWTIVPGTFTAPNDTNFYKALESVSQSRRGEQMALDASALAAGAGFNTADYTQYVIWVPQLYDWGLGGFFTGVNGLSQTHFNTFSADYLIFANLIIQGLGANARANSWVSNDSTVFGSAGAPHPSGIGDNYDVLGFEGTGADLNLKHKSGLGWLLPANIQTITFNGTYRVYAHDTETTRVADRIYGIRMAGYQGTQYWVEFREAVPASGVLINWGGLMLLDMVPGGALDDLQLTPGNTFTDPDGRSITFTATGGTAPAFVDLTIGGLADPPAGGKGMKGRGRVKGKAVIR